MAAFADDIARNDSPKDLGEASARKRVEVNKGDASICAGSQK
jgi:hypothetical protein